MRHAAAGLGNIQTNLVAGVVVGIIALPLSIALAVAVGVPPVAGLYTAAFAGAAASLFGGSNFNITGPTAALVPILAHVVLVHGPGALAMVGLMAGILLICMGLLRMGRLMRYMPGLVIVGFTAGIALSIAFGQLNNFLAVQGTDPKLERFHEKAWDTIRHLDTLSMTTPAVGLLSLGLLVVWSRERRVNRFPAPLVAVVAATAVTWAFRIDTPTLASRYGDLPSSFPTPSIGFFDAGELVALLPAAVAVAILGAIESLLSAVVADGMASSGTPHNPNRELVGQGVANLISPLMGGVPATAAIARTAAGIRNGGTSRLTGVFHAITVLAATLLVGSLAGHVPLATLAAVLLLVAWNIAEAPEVVRLFRRAPREDLIVLASTILITLFFDLSYAIAFGVLASAALLPDETGRIQRVSAGLSDLMNTRPDIAFFTAQGTLSFHSAAAFEYELHGANGNPLILRMKDVHHVDTSGLLTLEGIIEHRQKRGHRIILTAIEPDLYPVLARFGIIRTLGPANVFEHTRDAIAAIDAPEGRMAHPHGLAFERA